MTKKEWKKDEDEMLRESVAQYYGAGLCWASRQVPKRVQKISWYTIARHIERSPEACKSRAKTLGILRKQREGFVPKPNPNKKKPRWTRAERELFLQLLPPPGSGEVIDWADIANQIHCRLGLPLLTEDDLVRMYMLKDDEGVADPPKAADTPKDAPKWTEAERALLLALLPPPGSDEVVDWADIAQQIHCRLNLPLLTEDDLVEMYQTKDAPRLCKEESVAVAPEGNTTSYPRIVRHDPVQGDTPSTSYPRLVPDRARAPWTREEDEQIRQQYSTHRTTWHKYVIPGRSKVAVRNRTKRLLIKQ